MSFFTLFWFYAEIRQDALITKEKATAQERMNELVADFKARISKAEKVIFFFCNRRQNSSGDSQKTTSRSFDR